MATYTRLQTYKGLAFVIATAALFLFYIKPQIETLNHSRQTILSAEKELSRRLGYELATVKCMHFLLEPVSVNETLPKILEIVHNAVGCSRTYMFQNEEDPELGLCMSQIYEVVADGVTQEIDNPLLKHLPYIEGAPTLLDYLESRKPYAHVVAELDEPERTILAEQGILSILILPIYCGENLWGFVGFDDCENVRRWYEDDINLLWVVADGIGEAILRKKAEEALRESEERFKALHNASFGGITIHDKGLILDCNQGLSEISGYSIEELIGMDGLLLIAEDSRDTVMNNILSGFEEPYEAMGLRKDGTEYPVRLEARNIPYKGKKVRVVEFRDITEQKKAEEVLRQTSDRLVLATRAGGVGIWDYDVVKNTLVWDEQMFHLYGITEEDFSGAFEAWRTGVHLEDIEKSDAEVRMALRGEKEFDTEFRVVWPDGTIRNIRALAIVQRDESGNPIRMIGTNWDITSQNRAEKEIRESEKKYRLLFNQSGEGVYLHDLEGNLLDVNDEAVRQSGYSREELLNLSIFDFLPGDFDREDLLRQWSQRSPGTSVTLEMLHLHKNGSTYPVELTATNVLFDSKELIMATVRDITERKKAEEALRESESKLSSMISNISDVIAVIDENGINRYKSPNVEKWFGWKPEDIVGIPTWENIHPNDLERIQEIFADLLEEQNATVTAESRYRCKDGSYKWMEFTAINLLHDPLIKGVLLNYHNITDRKQAEDALRESEGKFRNYIENAPYGIFIVNKNGNYLEVNKTACKLTGYMEDELVGMKLSDQVVPEYIYRVEQSLKELQYTGFSTVEIPFIRKDGTICWLIRDSVKLSDTRYLVFASDITEKKNAEHSLIEAKLMAEENSRIKSEFLANMSHELRTPLTAVLGFSDILSSEKFGELNEKQMGFASHIHKSGEHLLELINDILDLSKIEAGKMELECEKFSLPELFDEIQTSMKPMAARKNIDLRIDDNIQNSEMFADRLKFKQIMFNLLSNAIKFTPEHGKVLVVAEKTDDGIRISVVDSGIGIPENRIEDIFNPFTQVDASNKRKYGGTGLGLTLVKQFVEMHNGNIWVESKEGEGSTFTFTLMDRNCDKKIIEICEVQ